jgi:hypothetical protein
MRAEHDCAHAHAHADADADADADAMTQKKPPKADRFRRTCLSCIYLADGQAAQ